VGEGLQVFVPLAGLLDLGEERARLQKELARLQTDVAGLRRKLDNPSFVARAPAEVVEKDRARVAELEQRRAKVQENLNRIKPEGTMSEKTPEEMFQSTPPTTPSSGMFGIPSEPAPAPPAPMAAAPAPRKPAAKKKAAAKKPARKKPKAKRAKKKAAPRKAKRGAKKRKAARKPARKAKRSGRRKVMRRTTKRRGRR
jgi:valyl-tRNA synthetase